MASQHWKRRNMRFSARLLLLIAIAGVVAGCTSSPFAWKLLYGQFDRFMANDFLSYAEFNELQEAQIRLAVDNTVRWHREQELPHYAASITEFQQRILMRPAQLSDIDWLFDTVTEIGRRFDARSPLLPLIPMLAKLRDTQTDQISAHFEEEFEDSRKERQKEAGQDPAERAAKGLQKFFSRLGLGLNQKQKARIIEQLKQRRMTDEARENIWRQWSEKLILILKQRQAEDFAQKFSEHHFARLTLMETNAPETWQYDRQLFKELLYDLFISLDTEQIESMRGGLDKLKDVALQLSAG